MWRRTSEGRHKRHSPIEPLEFRTTKRHVTPEHPLYSWLAHPQIADSTQNVRNGTNISSCSRFLPRTTPEAAAALSTHTRTLCRCHCKVALGVHTNGITSGPECQCNTSQRLNSLVTSRSSLDARRELSTSYHPSPARYPNLAVDIGHPCPRSHDQTEYANCCHLKTLPPNSVFSLLFTHTPTSAPAEERRTPV